MQRILIFARRNWRVSWKGSLMFGNLSVSQYIHQATIARWHHFETAPFIERLQYCLRLIEMLSRCYSLTIAFLASICTLKPHVLAAKSPEAPVTGCMFHYELPEWKLAWRLVFSTMFAVTAACSLKITHFTNTFAATPLRSGFACWPRCWKHTRTADDRLSKKSIVHSK